MILQDVNSPDDMISRHHGRDYWQSANADINGMLGGICSIDGFSHISKIDLHGSRSFLAKLGIGVKHGRCPVINILEGGAGIGRVTEGLLIHVGASIDVIEPVQKFTAQLEDTHGVRTIFNVGLEDWQPNPEVKYDLIWTQWCLGHLTDKQLVHYLEQCKVALNNDDGLVIIKENTSTSGVDVFDSIDSSITREDRKFKKLFREAGFHVVKKETQRGFPARFPRRLFPVQMYALRPDLDFPVSRQ